MKIIKKPIKSCCGSNSTTIILPKPLEKTSAIKLRSQKYFVSEPYEKNNCLYAKLGDKQNSIIITGIFGNNKLTIKCQGPSCQTLLDSTIKIFESL